MKDLKMNGMGVKDLKMNGMGVKDLKMNGMGINGSGDEWSRHGKKEKS